MEKKDWITDRLPSHRQHVLVCLIPSYNEIVNRIQSMGVVKAATYLSKYVGIKDEFDHVWILHEEFRIVSIDQIAGWIPMPKPFSADFPMQIVVK